MSLSKRVQLGLAYLGAIGKSLSNFTHFNNSLYSFTMSAHQASLAQAALVAKLTQPNLPCSSHARLATLEPYREVVKESPELTAHIEAQHHTRS